MPLPKRQEAPLFPDSDDIRSSEEVARETIDAFILQTILFLSRNDEQPAAVLESELIQHLRILAFHSNQGKDVGLLIQRLRTLAKGKVVVFKTSDEKNPREVEITLARPAVSGS